MKMYTIVVVLVATLARMAVTGAEDIVINPWRIPPSGGPPLENEEADVGDKITFIWTGTAFVSILPDHTCNSSSPVSLGAVSPVEYTFKAADAGKDITFASLAGGDCQAGQIMNVSVSDSTLAPTPAPSSARTTYRTWEIMASITTVTLMVMTLL